jgi:hypothetical protein
MKKAFFLTVCLLSLIVLICGSIANSQMIYYSPYPIYYPIIDPYYYYFPVRNAQVLGGGTTSLLLSALTTPTVTTTPTLFSTFTPTFTPTTTPTVGTLTTLLTLGGGGINTNTLLLLGLL